jgi:predicted histidine transporter YuiF (NhaC family)
MRDRMACCHDRPFSGSTSGILPIASSVEPHNLDIVPFLTSVVMISISGTVINFSVLFWFQFVPPLYLFQFLDNLSIDRKSSTCSLHMEFPL